MLLLNNCDFVFTKLSAFYLPGSGEGGKEKLVPLIQGPSDTKDLHMSLWLNEIRKPESLLAPDLLAFSVLVPQQGDSYRTSGRGLCFVLMFYFKQTFQFLFSHLHL